MANTIIQKLKHIYHASRTACKRAIILCPGIGECIVRKKYGDDSKLPSVRGMKAGASESFADAMEEAIDAFLTDEEKEAGNAEERKIDIVKCYLCYGTTPEEYFLFDFPRFAHKQRAAFVPRTEKDNAMIRAVGTGENYLLLHDKYRFYEKFQDMFHRDVCKLSKDGDPSAFIRFCGKHRSFIAKQLLGRGGFATMIRTHDGSMQAIEAEMAFLLRLDGDWIIEEVIRQDDEMKKLNASSVNTIRVCSYMNQTGFGIFETDIRMGRAGSVVDNACSGGITAVVDRDTGIIVSDAVDKRNHRFTEHPDNHLPLKGFQVPRWQELLQMAEEAHRRIPFYPYVGWDFALSEDGWVLVEGNWGNSISQFVLKKGIRKEFYNCFQ